MESYASAHEFELVDETLEAVKSGVKQDVFEYFGVEKLLFCFSWFEYDEYDEQVEDESKCRNDWEGDNRSNKLEPFKCVNQILLTEIKV